MRKEEQQSGMIKQIGINKGGDMNHAEICPVCKGDGVVTITSTSIDYYHTTTTGTYVCHGCGGCGWVVVPDDYIPIRT